MTNDMILNLKEVGLKKNEAEIYLYLLQNGLSTPPEIATGTSIARTNCYNILKSLEEKDVVEVKLKRNRSAYIARDPESLKLSLERKLEMTKRILPDLKASYVIQKNKPLFRFYEGWKEVREIYNLTLQAEKIYATGSTERLMQIEPGFLEGYTNKIKKKNIFIVDLLTADSQKTSGPKITDILGSLHSVSYLPEKYKENLTDILVWNDTVALITLEEPIYGTVITSLPLANTFRTLISVIGDSM